MMSHWFLPDVSIAEMVLGDIGVGSSMCQLSALALQKSATPPLLALGAHVARML